MHIRRRGGLNRRGERLKAGSAAAMEAIGVSAPNAAALLGISTSHFFGLLRAGRVGPEARRLGRRRLYDRDELLRWWAAGCPPRERWTKIDARNKNRRLAAGGNKQER
jgi:hypothetical protein